MKFWTLNEVKTLFEICAIFLGGFWAVYGFIVLNKRGREKAERREIEVRTLKTEQELREIEVNTRKAEQELRAIEVNTRKTEQELRQIAVLEIEIIAEQKQSIESNKTFLFITVKICNLGKRETQIQWQGNVPAFSVRRVVFNNRGVAEFPYDPVELDVLQARDPHDRAISNIIRPGGSQSLSFPILVENPGVYFLAFRGMLNPAEIAVGVAAGANENNPLSWTATKYVLIEKI